MLKTLTAIGSILAIGVLSATPAFAMQAQESLLAQETITDDALQSIRDEAGSRFAGTALIHTPSLALKVRVTGSEPLEIQAPTSVSVPLEIEYNAKHSFDVLNSIVESVEWVNVDPGVQGVYASELDGTIHVQSTSPEVTVEDFLPAIAKVADISTGEVIVESDVEQMGDSNRGGRDLGTCASAFTVRTQQRSRRSRPNFM